MDRWAFFFRQTATLPATSYPRGEGGDNSKLVGPAVGEPVPCSLQQDGRPARTSAEHQERRGSSQPVRIFFRQAFDFVAGDVITINGRAYTAEGPAYDDSGQAPFLGTCWCVDAGGPV